MTASASNRATFRSAHTTFVVCDESETVDVVLRGEYDLSSVETSQLVIERIGELVANPPRPVIVDLSGVTFFDAAGLSFLVRVDRVAQLVATTARVRNPNPDVRRLIEIVGLNTLLEGS